MRDNQYSRDELLTLFAGTEESEEQLQATCEAVNVEPTKQSFTRAEGDAVALAREWINSGECTDFDQVRAKWEQFQADGGQLEQVIEVNPNNNGLIATINKQGDALYDDIPNELANQKVRLRGAIDNAVLGRLDQRLREGSIDDKIEAAAKKLESGAVETFEQKLNRMLGLPPST